MRLHGDFEIKKYTDKFLGITEFFYLTILYRTPKPLKYRVPMSVFDYIIM